MNIADLFSPLDRKYCDYFYFLSVLFFVMFVIMVVKVLSEFLGKGKPKLADCLVLLTQPLLLYFINRLNYSMCVGSLR
jgi:hypothetical protein